MKSPSKMPLNIVIVLNVLQFLVFIGSFPVQVELMETGAMPPIAPILDLVANILLVLGAVFLIRKKKGEKIYLCSGIILLFAAYIVPNIPVSPLIPPSIYTTEILLSFIGWLALYRYRKKIQKLQVQLS